MSDTTIVNLRTTRLSIPWRDGPPAAGIVDPLPRQFLVVEIATKGGLTGMGYLHMLGDGSETIEACLREMVAPRSPPVPNSNCLKKRLFSSVQAP